MNGSNRHRDPRHDGDPLDELLRDAEWPEPRPAAVERLLSHWRDVSAGRRPARWLRLASAVAAALVAGAIVWWIRSNLPDEPGDPVDRQAEERSDEQENKQVVRESPAPGPRNRDEIPREPERSEVASRDATPYERLVLLSVERRSRKTASAKPDNALERVIEKILSDPPTDMDELVRPLVAHRTVHEERLMTLILRSSGERQRVLINLLGYVGSHRSVPLLVRLSRTEAGHVGAVQALIRLADPITLGELAHLEPDETLRRAIFAELISRRQPHALAVYLNFVRRRQTRESALAALDRSDGPPVEMLFRFLEGPDYPQRMAAAVALGHLDGPEITQRLIELVRHSSNRQEALAALLSSRGEDAVRFVSTAQRTPLLAAMISSARFQLQIVTQ